MNSFLVIPKNVFTASKKATRLMKWGFKEVTIQLNGVSEYQTLLTEYEETTFSMQDL